MVRVRPRVGSINVGWEIPVVMLKRIKDVAQGMDLQSRHEQSRLYWRVEQFASPEVVLVFLRLSGVDMRDIALTLKQSNRCLALRLCRSEVIAEVRQQLAAAGVTIVEIEQPEIARVAI